MADSEQLSPVRLTLDQVELFATTWPRLPMRGAGVSAPPWREAFESPAVLGMLSGHMQSDDHGRSASIRHADQYRNG